MSAAFDKFLVQYLYARNRQSPNQSDEILGLDDAEIQYLYEQIVDKLVVRIFENIIECEPLQYGFRKLTKMQRVVILLNVIMGFDSDKTAEISGISISNVYRHKSRALQRLKQELDHTN